MEFRIKFVEELLKISKEKEVFSEACKEWNLIRMERKTNSFCICNHAILDNYIIKNKLNSTEVAIGSECVLHFKDSNDQIVNDIQLEKKKMLKRKRELKKANRLKCKFCSFPVNEEALDYHANCLRNSEETPKRIEKAKNLLKVILENKDLCNEDKYDISLSIQTQINEKNFISEKQISMLTKYKSIVQNKLKKK